MDEDKKTNINTQVEETPPQKEPVKEPNIKWAIPV